MQKIDVIRSNIKAHYKKEKEEYLKKRASDNRKHWQKYYGDARWKHLRELKIARQPLCEVCEAEGRAIAAEHVHHIRRFSSAETENEKWILLLSWNNLMSLCRTHHNIAHEIMRQEGKDEVSMKEIIAYDEKIEIMT